MNRYSYWLAIIGLNLSVILSTCAFAWGPEYSKYKEGEIKAAPSNLQYPRGGLAATFFKGQSYYIWPSFAPLSIGVFRDALYIHPSRVDENGRVTGIKGPYNDVKPGNVTIVDTNVIPDVKFRNYTRVDTAVREDLLHVAYLHTEPYVYGSIDRVYLRWTSDPQKQANWQPLGKGVEIPLTNFAFSRNQKNTIRDIAFNSIKVGDEERLVLFVITDRHPNIIQTYYQGASTGYAWRRGPDHGAHQWQWHNKKAQWHRLTTETVIGDNGDPAILVAATTEDDGVSGNQSLLRMQAFDGANWHTGMVSQELNWVSRDGVAMAQGTIPSHPEAASRQDKRMVQIFGYNSGLYRDIRRIEYSLEGKYAHTGRLSGPGNKGWVDTGFPNGMGGKPRALAATTGFRKITNGVRQYVTLVQIEDHIGNEGRVRTATYPSDLYEVKNPNPRKFQTGGNQKEEDNVPTVWDVVGIIEGVPPFTNNAATSKSTLSKARYTKENATTKSVENTYSFNLGVAVGGEFEGVAVAQAELSYGIDLYKKTTQTRKLSLTRTFNNYEGNINGDLGYVLIAQPVLQNFIYTRRSADRTHSLGELNQLIVPEVKLAVESYPLEDPARHNPKFKGIPKRWPSSDPVSWYNQLGYGNGIDQTNVFFACDLSVGSDGHDGSCRFEEIQGATESTSHLVKASFSVGAKNILQLKGNASYKLAYSTTSSQTNQGEISVARMPQGDVNDPGTISSISLTGHWLQPKKDPYWLPDGYKNSRPWLMTWRINDISCANRTQQCWKNPRNN